MESLLQKTEVRLEWVTDIKMLLIIKKGMRERMCNAMHRYAKTSNKYMKNYIKNKESSYIQYFGENNLYPCAMPQRLPE